MAPAIMAHPDLRNPFDRVDLGGASAGDRDNASTTVLFGDRATVVTNTLDAPGLWVSPDDLTAINGFVLKPEGACLGELCIPLQQDSDLLQTVGTEQWFNLVAFADLMEQAYVSDAATNTWSFGAFPATRQGLFNAAAAPEFEVVDREGNVVRMADFKGKKALIITWSSW